MSFLPQWRKELRDEEAFANMSTAQRKTKLEEVKAGLEKEMMVKIKKKAKISHSAEEFELLVDRPLPVAAKFRFYHTPMTSLSTAKPLHSKVSQ